ncbi:MAG: ABC transporter permease [Sphaerochaetaceae bacterium]|jgi:ribose transport system permease protein|nr:ABC transporter permease [Sphaerochaetaceae bacterium]NLO61376.1 ABC transporter permease [Spirochaetales bacterium]MDD2405126.1 ABC transporter permease [Sphaerochaetaceae bacterium]MDD4258922.1 ABC transporter permease [Sphaerochaetaceae bacterium]MDD4762637.1 ABC transporter permease [Sphaerochaetaceae bacterium]
MRANKSNNIKKYAILGVLILLAGFFSIVTDSFLTASNLMNISRQVSMLGISAVGMTCVILTSGIDLSVGSVMAIVNIIGAKLMTEAGLPIFPAAVITLIVAAIVGLINGVMISYVGVPAFIVTLATMISLRGLAYVLCAGMPIWGLPDAFRTLGQGYLGPIPIPVIIMLIVFAIGWVFLNRTKTGRYIYGLGGNKEAVRLAGIRTARVGTIAYIISGFLTGLAGLIMLSRINTGQPKIGTSFEMDVITAVVLGGVSMRGGSGSILGVLVGVFITGILSNGMILLNISEYYQQIAKGLVLLFAVTLDTVANLRKN